MKYTSFKIDAQLLFMDKTNEISQEISSFLSDLSIAPTTIVKVECFAPVSNQDEYLTCSIAFNSVLTEVFKKQIPANLFVAQSLAEDPQKVLLKFCMCDEKAFSIEYKEFQKHAYCLVKNNEENILISGGIAFNQSEDRLRLVQSTFDFIEQLLDHEEMHFGHLAYQANYTNDISSDKKDKNTGWTNIQTIEEIRSLYFDPNLFKHGYPLQHTSHLNTDGFIIDFIATSKDGFPTAQYNLGTEANRTQNCFIPGLKKLYINSPVDLIGSTSEEQLLSAIDTLKALLDNCGKKTSEIIDEIKLNISDIADLKLIKQLINEQIKTNKLVLFHAPLQSNDLKIDIEAVVSINC
jgi:hypothetical protein